MGIFDSDLLSQALLATAPLVLAAMGELISQRAGIINVGLEGYMLLGAFVGFWAAAELGSVPLGVLAAVGAGLALSAVMAAASIEAGANQIVVGIALIILAGGLSAYVNKLAFGEQVERPSVTPMEPVALPGLHRIPGVGSALFRQPVLVYVAFLLVPLVWALLYRTRFGLGIRAVGDVPTAAEAAGMSVRLIRWSSTLAAGALGGLAGAFLSLVEVGAFIDDMSAGRGFLAIAAVVFGAWRPVWVVVGCFVFGGADALELRLQGQPTVPREVWFALMGVVILFVAARLERQRRAAGVQASLGPLRGVDPRSAVGLGAGLLVAGGLAFLGAIEPSFRLPDQLWLATPYVLTLVALAGLHARATAPRFLGASVSLR